MRIRLDFAPKRRWRRYCERCETYGQWRRTSRRARWDCRRHYCGCYALGESDDALARRSR
jgi:hypothetical protein